MAYDTGLAQRVREGMAELPGYVEREMFGGNARHWLHAPREHGPRRARTGPHRAGGPAAYQAALAEPDTREFDVTGRPMTGWIVVTADGLAADQALNTWLRKGISFAASLPPE